MSVASGLILAVTHVHPPRSACGLQTSFPFSMVAAPELCAYALGPEAETMRKETNRRSRILLCAVG